MICSFLWPPVSVEVPEKESTLAKVRAGGQARANLSPGRIVEVKLVFWNHWREMILRLAITPSAEQGRTCPRVFTRN